MRLLKNEIFKRWKFFNIKRWIKRVTYGLGCCTGRWPCIGEDLIAPIPMQSQLSSSNESRSSLTFTWPFEYALTIFKLIDEAPNWTSIILFELLPKKLLHNFHLKGLCILYNLLPQWQFHQHKCTQLHRHILEGLKLISLRYPHASLIWRCKWRIKMLGRLNWKWLVSHHLSPLQIFHHCSSGKCMWWLCGHCCGHEGCVGCMVIVWVVWWLCGLCGLCGGHVVGLWWLCG